MSSRYPFILAWGKTHGRYQYQISEDMSAAASVNAPSTVVYRDAEGRWIEVEELTPTQRHEIEELVDANW